MILTKKQERSIRLSDSGFRKFLDSNNSFTICSESLIIKIMDSVGLKYYGAIDINDTDLIFNEFGLIITPARNQGENLWYIENY